MTVDRLNINDFDGLVLGDDKTWDENYEMVKIWLDNVMKSKEIKDFKYNAGELCGALGYICGKFDFFKTDDTTGYVCIVI